MIIHYLQYTIVVTVLMRFEQTLHVYLCFFVVLHLELHNYHTEKLKKQSTCIMPSDACRLIALHISDPPPVFSVSGFLHLFLTKIIITFLVVILYIGIMLDSNTPLKDFENSAYIMYSSLGPEHHLVGQLLKCFCPICPPYYRCSVGPSPTDHWLIFTKVRLPLSVISYQLLISRKALPLLTPLLEIDDLS